MSKTVLFLVGLASMFAVGAISVAIILVFGDTYWAVAPLVIWFVAAQIWLVPKILKK